MDNAPQTQTPPPAPQAAAPMSPTPKKDAMAAGPIAVIAIIIGLIAVGAWYLMNQNLSEGAPATSIEELQNSDDPAVQAAMTQSSSDELDSIEADVSATDLSGVDESAAAINAEAQ